jgi:peptide/nickel transport system substrate-binding protein
VLHDNYWDDFAARRSRRSVLRGGMITAAGLTSGAVLAGCSTGSPAVPTVAPALAPAAAPTVAAVGTAAPVTVRPKYGGTFITAAVDEPPHQDVHAVAALLLNTIGPGVVYSRLLNYQAGPKRAGFKNLPAGDLAESWQQADDLTWVFKLRSGVRWHNVAPVSGRDLVADDIVFSLNRQRDLKVNASYLPAVERIEAVDKQTLRIVTPKPDADFLPALAHPFNTVVAKEAVDRNGDLKEGPAVGTGPWILESWDRNSGVKFVRNKDYFLQGLPYPDRFETPLLKDDPTRLTALRTKAIHTAPAGVAKRDIDRLNQAEPSFVVVSYKAFNQGNEVGLNVTRPPFTDKRVRQAISKAIDRQAIIDTIFEGAGWWSVAIPLPDPDWYLPEADVKRAYARDIAGAKQLLAEAGVPNGFEAEMSVLSIANIYSAPAEIIQQNLKEIGVSATIKLVDGPTYSALQSRGDHQFYCGAIFPNVNTNLDLFTKYHSQGSRNGAQLKDPKVDAMIAQQAVLGRDPEGRKRILQDIQRYLLDEVPYAFLVTSVTTTGLWGFVKDYSVGMPAGESSPLTYVWLDR